MDDIINIIQPQMKAKQQTFDVFIGNVPAEDVYCDSVRLNQVLMNILSNSVKFTPPGGRITVDLREEESEKGEDYVKVIIKVKDNGIGMSEEFKSRIFESFAREDKYRIQKTEGTGLGMAITKHIVDAMGGTIEVESEQSKGTEFTVTLDFERVTATEEDMILPDWNMLVVDDDEQLCRTAVDSLTEIGIKAEWTVSGASAVEIITERHKRGDDYHIILLDWQMPEMNGIETAREIRKNVGDNVPILLISAYDWSEIEPEAREAGINGFISKPLFKSTLFCGLRGYAKNLPAAEEKQEDSYNLEGKCVLVAEDNDINWEIACAFLKSMGMHAEHAEDGNACLYMFSYSEHGYYDAILMDLRMPQMSGYDSAKAIRKLDRPDRDIPIIAMSADAFSEDVQRCLDCGMNSHIAKPIDPKEVAKQLDLYINKQPTH
jgi:CheY-like chemotaxis protein